MPAQDHVLVEAVDGEHVLAQRRLEVAQRVVLHRHVVVDDLVEMEADRPVAQLGEVAHRIAAVERRLPQHFGNLEARHLVEAVGHRAQNVAQQFALVARHQQHVGVGVEDPAVARVGAPERHVARLRLERHQMGLEAMPDMLIGPDAQDAHDLPGLVGQRVVDRLGKGRMVVRRVVVDEQDLVVGVGHHLGERIEADRRPLVQVVAVAVVAAVEDDGKHL